MAVTSMKINDNKQVELTISVNAEDFGKAVDLAFKKNAPKMQIAGFRKGKAPRKMIEKMYGEGVFYEEAVNNTYPAAYEAAVEEKGIDPVDRASIDVQEVTKDGFTFTATVTVKPEVTVDGYKGIEVEKKLAVVTDDEIVAEIDRQREQNARMIAVEGRAAQTGDTATIDFEGFIDGVPFEGGKGEDYSLVLGSDSFIPGFEGQVVGHNAGEEFEVNVTFPDDYHAEALKGKTTMFQCVIKDLKSKELPALDDEFAKDVSEFDTLDALKADIRTKLQTQKDDQSQTEVEDKLMSVVAEKMVADIPECMYEARIDDMLRDFEYRLQAQGMDIKTYLTYTGMEISSFRKTFREQAVAQVKTRLALEKIVEMEKLVAASEEIEEEFLKIATNYSMDVEKIKTIVPLSDITSGLAMNKALDLVRTTAVIKEVAEAASVTEEKVKKPRAKKTAETPAE